MNSSNLFSDKLVVQRIEDLAARHGLKITACTSKNESDGQVRYQWTLKHDDVSARMEIVFYEPSYVSNVFFSDIKDNFFPFKRYLDQYTKSLGDLEILDMIAREQTWKDNWSTQLDILDTHLESDLGAVLRGDLCPQVFFRYEDYVTPEAIERLNQDSLKRLQTPENPNPWLYLVNFVKGKSKKN